MREVILKMYPHVDEETVERVQWCVDKILGGRNVIPLSDKEAHELDPEPHDIPWIYNECEKKKVDLVCVHDPISGNLFRTRRDNVDALAYSLPIVFSKDDRSKNKPTESDWDEWKSKLPKDAFKTILKPGTRYLCELKVDHTCCGYTPDISAIKATVAHIFECVINCIHKNGYIMLHDLDPYFVGIPKNVEDAKIGHIRWRFLTKKEEDIIGRPIVHIMLVANIAEGLETMLNRLNDDTGRLSDRVDHIADDVCGLDNRVDEIEHNLDALAGTVSRDYTTELRRCCKTVDALDERVDDLDDGLKDIKNAYTESVKNISHDIKNLVGEGSLQKTEIQNLLDRMHDMEKREKKAELTIGMLTDELRTMHETIKFNHDTLKNILDLDQKSIGDIEELRARVTKLETNREDDGK